MAPPPAPQIRRMPTTVAKNNDGKNVYTVQCRRCAEIYRFTFRTGVDDEQQKKIPYVEFPQRCRKCLEEVGYALPNPDIFEFLE